MAELGGSRDFLFDRISGRFYYGWAVLAVAHLGIFTSGPGQSHTFSVFVGPISADLGISSATIATAYGLATLIAAFCLPQMGRLVDRHGPRRMTAIVVVLLGLTCLAFGAASNFFWLALGFGALRFLGQGSLMLNCANLVSQWFSRKRGFALSLMALGFGISMAVHPPLAQYLVEEIGWRRAWVVLGVLTWVLMLPPVLLLVFDKPEDKGLRPDGGPPDDPTEAEGAGNPPQKLASASGITLSEALKTRTFYILAAGWFAIAMLVTSLHFYQVTILGAQGIGSDVAARLFTISAITMVVTMPLVGRLCDRFRTRYVFAAALLVMTGSLVSITFATDFATATLYALIFGLNNAFSMTLFGYLWPRYFGRRHLGSIQGTGQMIGVVGASLGPLPVGLAFDYLGGVTGTLQGLAVIPLLCAFFALFLKTPAGVDGDEHLE